MKSNIIRIFALLCVVLLSLMGCDNFQNNNEENTPGGSDDNTDLPCDKINHDYSILKHDNESHWLECSCGDKSNVELHQGGSATCTELAVCEKCNTSYGELLSHDYTVLKYDAESHWLECGCGDKSNIEAHNGGEATFTELAVCITCNTSYGELKSHDYENLVFDEELITFSSEVLKQEVDNGVSKAMATYTAEYTQEGIRIYFTVEDNDIFSSSNIGMSDNVEIQVLAHDTSYLSQRHTYNIICGANGRYLLRKWDKGYYECLLYNVDFDYTFNKNLNGYEGSVFFSYNILETNEVDAKGNIRVQFNMRNTSSDSVSTFEEYDYLGSVYELPYTWFVLNENNVWVRKDFEKFTFGNEYEYIFDNLASISSVNGEHKNVKNGSPMFKNSNVCLSEYGLPTELLEKGSYIRGDKNGYTTTIETDGYVVIAVNDLAGDLNQYFINQGYELIKKFGRTIASYLGTNSVDFIQLVNYYVKWLPAGSTITTNEQWCVVFGAKDNSLAEETWFTEPGYITIDMEDPMYAENDQIFTAAPSMVATQNKRIFSQWHTGGAYEPVEENCTKFKYSDDLGKTWNDAFVLDSWIDQVIGGDKNNVGCDYTLGINDKNELFIYYVFRENTNGNQTCNSSTWVMKLVNPDADPSEWEFTEGKLAFPNVLLKNAFRKLSDGTYILAGQYCPDERYINVYKSYDQCDTWELIGRVYSPQCNSYDEPIIMERNDGSLWMTMRTRKGVMYQSVSLDGGITWSISEKYFMFNANTRFYIGKMSNGYWYMIYNDSSTSRTKMTIAISKDEGQTWENKLCLYSSYCSYPDSVIIDEKIHLVFDDGRYKQYQWRTEEDGKLKTWGYIYHYAISEAELVNMSYEVLDVEKLDVVARCAEYTFDYIAGSGTESDPYLIKDRYAWNVISNLNVSEGMSFEGKYFKLTDNITIYGNKKIGILSNPFAGVFDGDGHTITYHMSFGSGEANQGLFGTISNTAVIKNLKVDGTLNTLNTGNANIGSIVGINKGGLIENCESSVIITANGDRIGGLVAICDGGKIINSVFKGTITTTSTNSGNGTRGIGGIVALLSSAGVAEISNCTNEGTITATCRQVAGIVGFARGTSAIRHTISNCVNNANIMSTSNGNDTANEGVSGIVAVSFYTNITNCENNGVITAKTSAQVGGVVGKCCDGSSVKNCVNNSTVIAIQYVGGICGRHVGSGTTMDSCTNNGDIYCTSTATSYGQIYGQNGATVTNCTENGTIGKYSE